jgi:transglutaminase-like putative cysteine protease
MNRFPIPVLLAAALSLVLCSCEKQNPQIDSISPRIGMMGEVLTIYGANFGNEQGESYVTIAGIAPTTLSYIEWSDTRISVRIPEFGDSGLVYVHSRNKKSNAALFSNKATIPEIIQEADTGIGPRILSVEPGSGSIGQTVTILGSGFGFSREGSGVFFAWDAESSPAAPVEVSGPGSVEVSEYEFGYEYWSEREIRVRVPDGAVSGSLSVKTPRGNSRPVFFDISRKPGTKIFRDKRSYAISYSADIRVEESSEPNNLYLWFPRPVTSASQRNIQILSRNTEPFVENYRGTTLFRMQNLRNGDATGITLSYLVEVYGVETSVRPQSIRSTDIPAAAYIQPSANLPATDPGIQEQVAAIVGREQNPYLKAEKIYTWLITNRDIQWEPLEGGALEALEQQKADPYMAVLLFCTLARAAGIPAQPVSGILINRNRQASSHYWAEFWISGFGWVPLDPALGAGAAPPFFSLHSGGANYYFGNLDNQRVAFSRGFTVLSQMNPQGRVTVREREYALQNLWEEAVGGLNSYSSLWSDVTINGVYVQ